MNALQQNSIKILQAAIERIEIAEGLAPAGSNQHEMYVKAALMNNWPVIRAAVQALARD
jgi:hypothetical protein